MKIKYFIFGCFLSAILNIYAQSEKITNGLPEKGDWNFNPKKLWEIEKAGDETFGNAGEPRIGIDEMLYLRDFDKKFSYVIDGTGKLISTFSKEESDDPGATKYVNCFTVDNKVIIGTPEKLHFYDKDGKFMKTVPGNIFVRFPYAFINEKRFFVGPGALAGLPQKADIFLVDIEKSTERRFAEITLSAEEKKLQPGGVVLGLIPQILMAYDKENNKIYFAKNSEYKIFAADESGKIISVFGRNISKNFVSDEQKVEHMSYFAGGRLTEEKIVQMGQNLPDSLTFFHRIFFNNGLIYIFRMTKLSTDNNLQEIDIFSKDGEYLYNSVIDFGDYRFENPNNIQIKDDTMYAVLINNEGKQVVVKFKIEVPAE